MVIITNLGGADISDGDFLIARRAGHSCVCYVTHVLALNELAVVFWNEATDAQPLCPNNYPNVLQSKVVEICPGNTSSVIPCSDVIDIAFVFAADAIEHNWVDVSGMTRVFFTRAANHVAFNPIVMESFPSRIWFALLSVKEVVRKLMSKKRQRQACRSSMSISLPLECWRYISLFLPPIIFQKNQTKVLQFSDLSLQSKSFVKTCAVIRIMSLSSMLTARQLFGTTFGVGTRNVPPRKGLPRKVMEVGNVVNVVNVSDVAPPYRFKEFISDQRIDLVFEEACRLLSVRVVYSDVRAENDIVRSILKFPRALLIPEVVVPAARVRRVRAVPVETLFVYNGKYFQVHQSDDIRTFATCPDDGEELRLSTDELWNILMS